MAVTIQQIGSDRYDSAFDLLCRFFAEEGFDVPPEKIRANLEIFLSQSDCGVLLAYIDGQPIGIATVSTAISVELGRMAEIDDLYVLPEARGQGVAGELIVAALDWCRAQGRAYVQVTITPEGEAAHRLTHFYDRIGFVDSGRKIMSRTL